jgi:phage FluMu protein Com
MKRLKSKGLIVDYKCYECGWQGKVKTKNRKVKCPRCGTTNDFWLDTELPPLNHRQK